MTFDNAAWIINGAPVGGDLGRRAQYAAVEGFEGVVLDDDLKVTQLDVPGVGVQIAPGSAVVLNRYQTVPNEAYTISNPGVHTIPSGEMPAANPSAKSYLVAVVIGDPDFSQAGHPWMGADDPEPGTEATFQYVRPTLIEVSAGTTEVPGGYPALAIARIDIPASTTTITNSMITDLRKPVRPKPERITGAAAGGSIASGGTVQVVGNAVIPARPYRRVATITFGALAVIVGGSVDVHLRKGSTIVRSARTDSANNTTGGTLIVTLEPGETASYNVLAGANGGSANVTNDIRYTYLEANVVPA